jgi:tetratricopeptide (TPR) repeat protein
VAQWRSIPGNALGKIEFEKILSTPPQSGYAMNYIHSPDERTATLFVDGSNIRIWLNGRSVYQHGEANADGGAAPTPVRIPITLKAGRNVLLLKVNSEGGPPSVAVRLGDAPFVRGDDLASVGLWKEALASHKRGIEGTTESHRQRMYALLLLLNGDKDAFRNYCRELTKQHRSATGTDAAVTIAHTWCLAPDPDMPAGELIELAETAATGVKHSWVEFELALALYRAGKFEKALAKLDQAKDMQDWPKVWVLRGMAHHQLGQAGECRNWLSKTGEWYDRATREARGAGLTMPFHPGWWEQARFQLLYREARQLIDDPKWTDANEETLQKRARAALRPETFDYDLALLIESPTYRLLTLRAGRWLELKRIDDAKADFEEALKLRAKDPELAWRDRGQIEAAVGDPQRAAEAFSKYLDALEGDDGFLTPRSRACLELAQQEPIIAKLLQVRAQDTALPLGQARLHAVGGRWAEAAAVLGKVIDSRPNDESWFELASFQLLAGDEPGYRKTCERFIERVKDSKEQWPLYFLTRMCALAAKSPADTAQMVKWGEAAVANQTGGWWFHVLAAAHFRAGQYPEALRRIEESEKTGWGGLGSAQNAVLRAMTQFKQGEAGPARASLKQGIERMEDFKNSIRNQLDLATPDWYELQVLRREAEALIEPPAKKNNEP